MTRMHDGPAKGQVLSLKRAPLFLRVVQNPHGKWDALDQLEDKPEADEMIAVYRRTGKPGVMHIDRRHPTTGQRSSAWFACGEYWHYDQQPSDHEARDNPAWQAWCQAQAAHR